MAKYIGGFIPDLSECTTQIRALLQKNLVFLWSDMQQREFEDVQNILCCEMVLQFYDPRLPIKVSADASKHGLRAILQQKHGDECPMHLPSFLMPGTLPKLL